MSQTSIQPPIVNTVAEENKKVNSFLEFYKKLSKNKAALAGAFIIIVII